MTWGAQFLCYSCNKCGKKYKYDLGMLGEFGSDFGTCPDCGSDGTLECEGPVSKETQAYEEVE